MRPNVLLVPSFSEVQWVIKPQLEEWANVASYDPPGVGTEPPIDSPRLVDAIIERGIAEIDRTGWERLVVVGDDFGSAFATLVATARSERIAGLALGHACIEHRLEGDRPTMNPEVAEMSRRLIEMDFRTYIRQDAGVWDRRPGVSEPHEALATGLLERVPQEFAVRLLDELYEATSQEGASLEPFIRELRAPLLLARHAGCVFFTDHGFEDAVAAFPEATTFSTEISLGLSPEFADALRAFVEPLFESGTRLAFQRGQSPR